MKNIDVLIFIDANLYIPLYGFPKWKKLLDLLKEQKDYIFVTVQIVEEVQRNKLSVVAGLLTNQLEHLKESRSFNLPDYIFDGTDTKLRETLGDLRKKQIETDLMKAAIQALQRISRSEDKVSKALAAVFSDSVSHTPEEIRRARERKERGNPPGKPEDPLGDQLTWEQLLSQCKGKSKLWIISNDLDYCTKFRGKMFLNPLLYRDLAQVRQPTPEVFCFGSIDEGIRDFVKRTGVKAERLPTLEESKEIKKELDALPPLGWLDTSMDDANIVALVTRRRQQMLSPALRVALYSQGDEGWHPGMKPDPDKTDK
jgi:hypothetical protein